MPPPLRPREEALTIGRIAFPTHALEIPFTPTYLNTILDRVETIRQQLQDQIDNL